MNRIILLAVVAAVCLSGCATVQPDKMFPREPETRRIETVWLAMHAVDTIQTMEIARKPGLYREANPLASAVYGTDHPSQQRVLLTNVAMGLVHARVSRWFDDGVDRARARGGDAIGPWVVGRAVWYGVSFLGTGYAISNNALNGLWPLHR